MPRSLSIAVVLLLAVAAFGQAGYKITPRDPAMQIAAKGAARRYCQMDAEGFRLSSMTERRLQAATTWKELPEWQGFDVISDFNIVSAKWNARGLLVKVEYTVLGRFEMGVGYTPEPHAETIDLQLLAENDAWKVEGEDEIVRPRVLRARTLKWLKDEMVAAKDDQTKKMLDGALRRLQ